MLDVTVATDMLSAWAQAAESLWYETPDRGEQGCYGTGYNTWGAQTNQKYTSALAFLAARGDEAGRDFYMARALAALRYELATHVSSALRRTDGSQWGHTWISSLGVERMMFGVYLIDDYLSADDRAALDRILASEADWLTFNYTVVASMFNAHGGNKPESNLWNGAVCWRAAMHNPEHPHVELWKEKARTFLVNAVSVPADIGTMPRNVGNANFFHNYALDHHGYLNVGYMVICVSNAAMLHFDMKSRGWPAPAELMHHQKDFWQVLRRMLFSDGRLCRIGGDTRVRYAYCQDYLLPSLLLAAEAFDEEFAPALLAGQMDLIAREFDHNGDGSFYGKRLSHLGVENPVYYPRLESDRAGVLAMAARYAELLDGDPPALDAADRADAVERYELSTAGPWSEPHYGAAMQRGNHRIASFTWHSKHLDHPTAMGLCTPPDDGHLAEWSRNLVGLIRPCHSPYFKDQPHHKAHDVARHWTECFDGGFVTCGEMAEGRGVELAEGWRAENLIMHRLAFAALPDGHSVIGLQYCRPVKIRTYLQEAMGMNLAIPNDLFNGFTRTVRNGSAEMTFTSPATEDALVDLGERWFNVDNRVGAIGLYGADRMHLRRTMAPDDGKYRTLHIERFGWFARQGQFYLNPGESLFDIGWMVVSDLDAERTSHLARLNAPGQLTGLPEEVRAVEVIGADDRKYLFLANFSDTEVSCVPPAGYEPLGRMSPQGIAGLSCLLLAGNR